MAKGVLNMPCMKHQFISMLGDNEIDKSQHLDVDIANDVA